MAVTSWRERLGRALPDSVFRSLKYRQVHGTWPSLGAPRRFTEKINWRILNDRRDLLAWTGDKLAMKTEAAARWPGIRIPRTCWIGTDPAELVAVDLPDRWVLKPNNSSGRYHLGAGPVDDAAVVRLRALTGDWLDAREFARLREWAYSRARPVLFVEERIGGGATLPSDYKVFVFDGVPRCILVVSRPDSGRVRTFFTVDWAYLPVPSMEPSDPGLARPVHLERLLRAAADLGRGFDHIRVDLYELDGEIWFGEFTPYSWSGLERIVPVSFDLALGACWTLPDLGGPGG
jgi:hypothetical protein